MRFLTLALKNLLRRKVRSALTVLGVALAVAVAVSLMGFRTGYKQALSESIDRLGFQVMVMAKGCPYEAATMMLKGGTGLLYVPDSIYAQVGKDKDIDSITPIFIGLAMKETSGLREDAGSSFTIMAGIEQESFATMKPWLKFKTGQGFYGGHWFAPESEDEVVMGYEAATYEQRKVGDKIFLPITPNGAKEAVPHTFKIVGILDRAGSQDDGTVFLPFKTAQKIFNRPNQLTIVGVKLKTFNRDNLREFTNRWISLPEVQVVDMGQVKDTITGLLDSAQTMIAAVAVIAVLVALIGVVNTILMSVYERTGEIGIMKAIGAYRGDIFTLIWFETLFVCALGGALGCGFALVGTKLVEAGIKSLINLGVSGSVVRITPDILACSFGGAILVGFFAGLYPAWRAASMRPVEAIREGIG